MTYLLDDIRNRFDFCFRKYLAFSRKNYYEKPQNISDVIVTEQQKFLYDKLKKSYPVENLETATQRNFLENIYLLNLFDSFFTKKSCKNLSALDIGSKNWSYVKSEYIFFNSFCKETNLNGIELDAYRLCSNFYNRYEISKFHTKNLNNTEYLVGDFLEHNQKYDYIVWILPFITEYPLIKWGLPLKYYKPKEMLVHAYNLLNDGGELLIINQGEDEYAIQQNLNKCLNLNAEYYGEIEDIYDVFRYKRYCSKIIKC